MLGFTINEMQLASHSEQKTESKLCLKRPRWLLCKEQGMVQAGLPQWFQETDDSNFNRGRDFWARGMRKDETDIL